MNMSNITSSEFLPSTTEEVIWDWMNWVDTDLAWGIAGVFSMVGSSIALYNITKHLYNYTKPGQQLYIIRILFIVPLYALISWLTIRFHTEALYFEIVRDIYEAFVIYCFLILILGYVGGEANCVALISLKPPLAHPWPLCCLPKMDLNVKFLRFCKQSCIQFIVLKPILAFLNIAMLATGYYWNFWYQTFIAVVYNIAYTLALYGLLLFYMATRDDIRAYSPVRKFLAVKIVIFATYWQGLIVSYTPGISMELCARWNDFILCCEMGVFAIMHLYSYPWWEFRGGITNISKSELKQNAKSVLSFKDVLRDVYHNIAPTYQTYVLQMDDGEIKTFETKTFMLGNMNDPKVHNRYMPNFAGMRKKYPFRKNKNKNDDGMNNNNNNVSCNDADDEDDIDCDDNDIEIQMSHKQMVMNRSDDPVLAYPVDNDDDDDHAKVFDDFGQLGDDSGDIIVKNNEKPSNSLLMEPSLGMKVKVKKDYELIDIPANKNGSKMDKQSSEESDNTNANVDIHIQKVEKNNDDGGGSGDGDGGIDDISEQKNENNAASAGGNFQSSSSSGEDSDAHYVDHVELNGTTSDINSA